MPTVAWNTFMLTCRAPGVRAFVSGTSIQNQIWELPVPDDAPQTHGFKAQTWCRLTPLIHISLETNIKHLSGMICGRSSRVCAEPAILRSGATSPETGVKPGWRQRGCSLGEMPFSLQTPWAWQLGLGESTGLMRPWTSANYSHLKNMFSSKLLFLNVVEVVCEMHFIESVSCVPLAESSHLCSHLSWIVLFSISLLLWKFYVTCLHVFWACVCVWRNRHSCIGKQMLWWYLRHCATWDGRCRQGSRGRDAADMGQVPRMGSTAGRFFGSPSGGAHQCATQEFNGGWSFAVDDILEGKCKRWDMACFWSQCKGSSQAPVWTSASGNWNTQRMSSVGLKCTAWKCFTTPWFVKCCNWRIRGSVEVTLLMCLGNRPWIGSFVNYLVVFSPHLSFVGPVSGVPGSLLWK